MPHSILACLLLAFIYAFKYALYMIEKGMQARVLRAAEIAQHQGITQAEIAHAVNASQPQISRILSGRGLRRSRLQEEVCLYIERSAVGVTADAVRSNNELVEALKVTWDGSASHSRALATVIRSLSVLRRGTP